MEPKILVVEDKALLAQDIIDRLEQYGYKDVLGPFAYGEEALLAVQEYSPDVALLDIALRGKMTGIELARNINSLKSTPIIYLSNREDEQTFQDSLQTFPVAFLNKPFTNNELKMAIFNALKVVNEMSQVDLHELKKVEILDDRIFVRNGRGKFSLKLDDILWIQSSGGETSSFMTKDRLNIDSKLLPVVGHNLSRLEDRLAFYPFLVRCSRYFIVNLKAVEKIIDATKGNSKRKLLIHEKEIVIGDKFRKNVMDRFHII